MREAAFTMSVLGKREGCTVVVHGSDPVDHLEKYFANKADIVVCGEGEHTLLDVLNHTIRGVGSKETIDGIAFLEDGSIRRTPERHVEKNLDLFPFPARDLIDVEHYRRIWQEHHGYFSTNIVTTRGCPFHCNWCAKPVYGQVYNTRSPLNVVQEMKYLKQSVRPDHLWFCDDIFGLKPGWIEEFSREVVQNDATIPFKCLARVDLLLKDNAVEHLRAAGCTVVWVGAESGSQKILDAMDKGTTVEQIYRAAKLLKQNNIAVGFFLQYGYPGETMDDIHLTLKMVKECAPDEIGVSVSYPLPGTRFYERVRSEMQEKTNWVDSNDLEMMFAGTFPSNFYRVLHRLTHKKFRAWQGASTLQQVLHSPRKANRKAVRSIAAAVFHSLTLPLYQRKLASFTKGTALETRN